MGRKDCALFDFTKKFDGFDLNSENLRVSKDEIDSAAKRIKKNNKKLFLALKHAHGNIMKYHKEQFENINKNLKVETDPGIEINEKITAVESIGCYVPGGRAQYPSSVLMTAITAKVAGVSRIAIVSPPEISDAILAAAHICGLSEIYRLGGAQAIAALTPINWGRTSRPALMI